MTKLELLNTFLNDRLTAAAEEIFRAVKETVQEYQSEILRSKEENERLQRLLNVTVQRLLLQQPDLPSVQCRGEGQASEARGSVEPTAPIKEEPKRQNIHTGDPGEGDDLEQVQASPPHLMVSLSPPPLASGEVKAEAGRDEGRARLPADSLPSSTTAWSNTAKKQQRTEQQSRKQSALRPMLPRPSPPSPGIQRWHSCRECGKGFSFACQLEVHMRWHTKEKPYSCSVCRKSFTTVSMLKRHHRIHTGEKPFHCHVCGKCFNQSAHLNTHFRLHTRERASWSRSTASAKT